MYCKLEGEKARGTGLDTTMDFSMGLYMLCRVDSVFYTI